MLAACPHTCALGMKQRAHLSKARACHRHRTAETSHPTSHNWHPTPHSRRPHIPLGAVRPVPGCNLLWLVGGAAVVCAAGPGAAGDGPRPRAGARARGALRACVGGCGIADVNGALAASEPCLLPCTADSCVCVCCLCMHACECGCVCVLMIRRCRSTPTSGLLGVACPHSTAKPAPAAPTCPHSPSEPAPAAPTRPHSPTEPAPAAPKCNLYPTEPAPAALKR
eukprot:352374-Chlamydomonas_euryale.AAC.2